MAPLLVYLIILLSSCRGLYHIIAARRLAGEGLLGDRCRVAGQQKWSSRLLERSSAAVPEMAQLHPIYVCVTA